MTETGCCMHVCSVLSAVFIFRQSSILIRWKASSCAIKMLTSTSAREIPCGERLTCMRRFVLMSTLPSCRFLSGCKNCWKENGRFLCQMEICWDWILCGGGGWAGCVRGLSRCGSLSQEIKILPIWSLCVHPFSVIITWISFSSAAETFVAPSSS